MTERAEITTSRQVYQMDGINSDVTMANRQHAKKHKKKRKWSDGVRSIVPAVDWLLHYKWSEWIMEDTMSGITVAVLNIPQGMANSILANVEPTVGLYMAVFPVLVYALFGTSRHISLGVLSVICLMTGKVVSEHVSDVDGNPTGYSEIQVATAVTMVAGLVQVLMYVFRLGIISNILSDSLVSGFTGGVAVIVLTSQFKELLGVDVGRRQGPFHVPFTFYDFVDRFHTINWTTTAASTITILTLVLYNKYLKERVNKKTFIPVPIELIVTVVSTLIFQFTTISHDHHMKLVGEIKSGLPAFELPPIQLYQTVFVDSFVIALIGYSYSMSSALLMSEKMNYKLDNNQELLAQGLSNIVGSFFACLPSAASPSRSASIQAIGGKTQLSSIVSAAIMVVVLLWIGPVFEPLPRCVLSSIVVVALKSMFLRVLDIPKIWKASKSDGILWIVTYMTVILVDIDTGLLTSVIVSLLFVLIKGILIEVDVLGRIPNTDLYVNLNFYSNSVELPNIKIIRYNGSLNVINRYMFKRKAMEIATFNNSIRNQSFDVVVISNKLSKESDIEYHRQSVVFDMSGLQYVDTAGAKLLQDLTRSLISEDISVYLAAVPDRPLDYIRKHYDWKFVKFFPTVHDAVRFHQYNNNLDTNSLDISRSSN